MTACSSINKLGKEMYFVDTLSRAYIPVTPDDQIDTDLQEIHVIEDLPIAEHWLAEIIGCYHQRHNNAEAGESHNEWPYSRKKLPKDIREFFTLEESSSAKMDSSWKEISLSYKNNNDRFWYNSPFTHKSSRLWKLSTLCPRVPLLAPHEPTHITIWNYDTENHTKNLE